MGRHNQPTRRVLPDEVRANDVVLVRIAGNPRWLLLDHVDSVSWRGRFVYSRPGLYDGAPAPGDDWRRRSVLRHGKCVLKGAEDAARDRARLDQLGQTHPPPTHDSPT